MRLAADPMNTAPSMSPASYFLAGGPYSDVT